MQVSDFDLEAILGKVAISMSMLEIVTPLKVFFLLNPDSDSLCMRIRIRLIEYPLRMLL